MKRYLCLALLTAAAVAALAAPVSADLTFIDDVETAGELSEAGELIVLYFSSPRCGWCRKLEAVSLGDPRTQAVAEQFVWVKVPQSQVEMLAGINGVMGLPCLLVVNRDGLEVARHTGYLAPGPLADFLRDAMEAPEPGESDKILALLEVLDPRQVDRDDGGAVAMHVRTVVKQLAGADRAGRAELITALTTAGEKVRAPLCELLSSEQLSIRAAAFEALARMTEAPLPFDPFAAEETRNRQVTQWRSKLNLPTTPECVEQSCPTSADGGQNDPEEETTAQETQ